MARTAKTLLCIAAAAGLLLAGCKPERKEQVKTKVRAAVQAVAESRPVQKMLPKRPVPAVLAPARAAAASASTAAGLAGYTALYRSGMPSTLQERADAVDMSIRYQDFAAADALATTPELKARVAEGRRQKAEADEEERRTALADLEKPGFVP